jgi:hypothetical protein
VQVLSNSLSWMSSHVADLLTGGALWILMTGLTILAVRYYLIWIPADHFAKDHRPFDTLRNAHPALRWSILIAKNLVGALLTLFGLLMLVTPGPGWFALLLGLSLLDIPGKRAAERKILQRPTILKMINHLRAKAHRPPLEFGAVSS